MADADVARRLLALALVLDGRFREEAATACGMDRQTLRDWGHATTPTAWPTCRIASRRLGPPAARAARSALYLGLSVRRGLPGAGWHQPGDRLVVPANLSLLHLPPYCPELKPVENVWQFLRQNFLSQRACLIRSIASRPWATVKA